MPRDVPARGERLTEEPRHGSSVSDPVLFIDTQMLEAGRTQRSPVAPSDSPGSTFHAFSEPHWIEPQLQAHPPEPKRDDDIDEFTKALESR